MDIRPRFALVAAALLACALAACGDDNGTGTPNDTTPPGVSNVTPIDDHHIDITFSEQVTKGSAEDESNYAILPAPVPLGGTTISGATLKGDNKTVSLSTAQSMAGQNLQVTVHNVVDMSGNKMGESGSTKSFTGSNTTDETAPTVVSKAPVPNATNIAVNATVVVNFSEAIQSATALWAAGPAGVSMPASPQGGVNFSQTIDGAKLTLTLSSPLAYSQLYTVTVNASDYAGNSSGAIQWSFTTTANNDHTPPTLVSTVPANLAANVDVNGDLSVTFSEAVYQVIEYQLTPDAGDGVTTWSEDGKTLTFNPNAPLLDNQQYTFTIFPNGVLDLAGNGIVGVHTVQFTTAAQLAGGSIGGTITGDPGTGANDPTGAQLIATDSNPFNSETFNVFGSNTVAGNNTYNVLYLPDNLYYIITVMDTNHDGDLDPSSGDAVGGFGVDVPNNDLDPDGIAIEGGAHVTGKNFAMFDPATIGGTVTYSGAMEGPILVGLFDTNGFSIDDTPIAGTDAFGINNEWLINQIETGFTEDTVYVGAFMDVNGNQSYDPASEPAGFYGGLPAPTAVSLSDGADRRGIVVPISDPVPGMTATNSIIWPKAKPNAAFQRLVDLVRQSQQQASR